MISEVPLRTAVVKLSAGRWAGLAEALMWSRVREPLLPTVAGRCCLARVLARAKSQEANLDGVFRALRQVNLFSPSGDGTRMLPV